MEWKEKQSQRGIAPALWAEYPTNKYWLKEYVKKERYMSDKLYNCKEGLGCSESTNVIQPAMESSEWGKKRKYADDEEAPLTKNPQVEASYKFGPRNAPPGKIKKALAFLVVVQDPVKKDKELFKPPFHKQLTIGGVVSQASSKPFDFMELGDDDPVKPKPKPKPCPIKGKVSTSELGIVTWDWSKRIAEESVHSTRSKKL